MTCHHIFSPCLIGQQSVLQVRKRVITICHLPISPMKVFPAVSMSVYGLFLVVYDQEVKSIPTSSVAICMANNQTPSPMEPIEE